MDDDFIGKRFGRDGHLEVIRVSGRKRSNKVYAILCHKCKLDPELFGDGIFHRVKRDLIAGNIPCGCSKAVKWTKDQYRILVNRHCKELGYVFINFTGDWKGKWTKVMLQCDKGHDITMALNNFLYGFNCKICGNISAAQKSAHSYEYEIESFYKSGKIPAGTIFSKSLKKTKSGYSAYWDYKCGICSQDEYVKAGVCSGVFTSVASSLKEGHMACRCGVWHKWDQTKREYQIRKRLTKEQLDLKFLRWENEGFGIYDVIWFICGTHGEFKTTVGSFLHSETGCPRCSRTGFNKNKPAVFYILKIDGESTNFTGYGISGNIEFRLNTHSKVLNNSGCVITDRYLVKSDGVTIFNLEKSVKDKFEILPQTINGFKKEATYSSNYNKLVEYAIEYVVKHNYNAVHISYPRGTNETLSNNVSNS